MNQRIDHIACFVISIVLTGMIGGCDRGTPAATQAAVETLPRVDLAGLKKIIADTAGGDRVLVIDFWATWCGPCVEMFPGLHAGVEKLGPGVRIVSVTLDAPGNTEAAAVAFLTKNHAIGDALMLAPNTDARLAAVEGIGKKWQNLVVPAILVYDRRGGLAEEFQADPRVEPILVRVRELMDGSVGGAKPQAAEATTQTGLEAATRP